MFGMSISPVNLSVYERYYQTSPIDSSKCESDAVEFSTKSFKNDETALKKAETEEEVKEEVKKEEAEPVKEVSSQNADFHINTGYEGGMKWGQLNTDGTYTIYSQPVIKGSEPTACETITLEEAAERGYVTIEY